MPNKVSNITNNTNQMGMRSIFIGCTSLDSLPDNFSLPDVVTQAGYLFSGCFKLRGKVTIGRNVTGDIAGFFGTSSAGSFYYAGSDPNIKNLDGYNTSIVVRVYKDSYADQHISNTKYVTKEYIDDTTTSTQTLDESNDLVVIQNATDKIMIEDSTEEISVRVNQVDNTEKLSIEDETDYVSVTVNKNVEENKSDEDEIQE